MQTIRTIADVVTWRLCLGCGACAYICKEKKVKLVDFAAVGIRPVLEHADCGTCRDCLDVCPAVQSDFRHAPAASLPEPSADLGPEWGPVLSAWEGHATDPEIRFQGSSGGALTAIGAYCLDTLGMHGVLHIGQDSDDPVRNRTRLSRSRAALSAACGSRYSPACVCNGLGLVEDAPAPCAIIGQPSEIAAVRNAIRMRQKLERNVGLTLSFFCAGSPSTLGTLALLQRMSVDMGRLRGLRYRGMGWPGHFAPTLTGEVEPCGKLPYRESWAFLQAYRPWSAQMWPDGAGELADICCGDPWYVEPDGRNPGFSLVLARTKIGHEIIEGAIRAGYLTLNPAEPWKIRKSQNGLLQKKGAVWGRRLAMRSLVLPVTRLDGLDLRRCWQPLPMREKIRATLGTLRRVFVRKLYRPMRVNSLDGVPVKQATLQ